MTLTRLIRPLLVASLVLIAIALTACAGAPPAGAASGAAPGASAQPATPPTMKLVTPTEGATLPAGDVQMAVETTGLKFVMPSNTVVAGEGHVHFTLDDKPFQMSTDPEYVMKDVAPGPHTLKAELVQNDTKSFDPPVFEEITFIVQ